MSSIPSRLKDFTTFMLSRILIILPLRLSLKPRMFLRELFSLRPCNEVIQK